MTLRTTNPDSNIVHKAWKEKISQEFLKQLRAYSDEEWGDVREQISESLKQARARGKQYFSAHFGV